MVDESITTSALQAPQSDLGVIAWIDIFHGMLISPIRTLNVLNSPNTYMPGFSALLGSGLMVILCALAKGFVGAYDSSPAQVAWNVSGSFLASIIFWLALALFVRLIAAFMRIETSTRCCFIATGWAFVPLIFKSIAACFTNATIFGDVLSGCLSLWFLVLQLFAFDSLLKLGRFKTLGIILILPPLLYFTYFISMIFVGALLCDGLF